MRRCSRSKYAVSSSFSAILLALVLLALGLAACTGTHISRGTPDGDTPDGDIPDGDMPDGDVPDGDTGDGDISDGDKSDGDSTDGDGDTPDGEGSDGDGSDGDTPDGDVPDGDGSDGDTPDGDGPDGDEPDGDTPDGDDPDLCLGVDCGPCNICNTRTGLCDCLDICETETYCDGLDDDCNGQTDENGVCDGVGIRVELSWSRREADMDLHVLRPRGVFGTASFVDYHDTYFANPNPDWGVIGNASDNPRFQGNVTNGGGQDVTPEIFLLPNPPEHPLRVVVHYPTRSGLGSNNSTVWVKVWMDGELKETFSVSLENTGSYWNVACLDYAEKTVTPIRTSANGPEIARSATDLNTHVCLSVGAPCQSVCDCPPEANCTAGTCQITDAPTLPCCANRSCPGGSACRDHNNEPGLCGAYIQFERDPAGSNLSVGTPLESTYLPWGVGFSTPRANSFVAVDSFRLVEGNSCATRDSDSEGTRWRGNIHINLFMPVSSSDVPPKAQAYYATFVVGDTRVTNGLRVTALSASGQKLSEQMVSGSYLALSGAHIVRVLTATPFHSLRIEVVNDPDFVIDNLQVGPMWTAP